LRVSAVTFAKNFPRGAALPRLPRFDFGFSGGQIYLPRSFSSFCFQNRLKKIEQVLA
jgi:hypothetical protein